MTVYHIVLFQFKALVPPDEDKTACQRILDLETKCVHPTSQKPYMRVLGGGKDNSIEGRQVKSGIDFPDSKLTTCAIEWNDARVHSSIRE